MHTLSKSVPAHIHPHSLTSSSSQSTIQKTSTNPIYQTQTQTQTQTKHKQHSTVDNWDRSQKNMLKKGTTVNGDCSRVCDMCRSAACTVYCRADSAYLCSDCDARIHAANRVASRHERVWVCEACERAPAAFLCKADAASLCSSYDADIHSANPLANRHHCVPVLPLSGFIGNGCEVEEKNDDEAEAASWLLLNPVKNDDNNKSNGFLFGEKYLDLVDCNSCGDNQFSIVDHHQQHNYCSVPQKSFAEDSVVPVQMQHQQAQHFQQGLKFDSSKASFSYNGSINQSMPSYLTPSDRESRILRYREKKKTRNFEKKIRYASRKAYAETRPRIKGRFAKRTDVVVEVDQMFSSTLMTEAGYSVVPSF